MTELAILDDPQTHSLELITELDAAGAEARFDVRSFGVVDAISTVFHVAIKAMHSNPSLDFDAIVGRPARFSIFVPGQTEPMRVWSGIITEMELARAVGDPGGLSSYELSLMPSLWLLTQRRNYRIHQYQSEVDVATSLLDDWKIDYELRLDRDAYKARK
jgi:type VI secretion system secreted protein VgrG